MNKFKKLNAIFISSLLMFGGAAYAAGPECGEARDDSWMEPEVMLEQIESLGYTIETLGVSAGNCYEATGLNVQGEGVTAYFDPKTGGIVQEDIAE